MTDAKTIRRRRRNADPAISHIPPEIQAWFAAGSPAGAAPWPALLPPTHGRLPQWWAQWKSENPNTRPDPAVLGWLEPIR